MSTSLGDVIEAFRSSPSNSERGRKFEELMVRYLELDPLYAAKFSNVWLWKDWPGRQGKPDTGIDLVAQDRETGEYTAIQCKFYEPEHILSKSDIDSFFTASGKAPFSNRIIISTTDKWGDNAEYACQNQQIPVQRIGMSEIAAAPIDWSVHWTSGELSVEVSPEKKKEPLPHQGEAIADVFEGFDHADRGQLIMACGTGKTFTSLKIAEYLTREKAGPTQVLFLVPSLSLLSQTLREWTGQTETALRAFAVCSDRNVGSRTAQSEDINVHDLALPATTNPDLLYARVSEPAAIAPMTVVFSTYQSIDVIARAQQLGLREFDLVICDEAHRTTGVTLADRDESNFVKVHDQTFIQSAKRLYMTATPRVFSDEAKDRAASKSAALADMRDHDKFGPTFHRLGFGEAVDRGLLTDYKVVVLTVDESYIAGPLQNQIVDDNREISLDDATKIVGCWNGLSKRTSHRTTDGDSLFASDLKPMQRAVAFLKDIKTSKKIAAKFEEVVSAYEADDEEQSVLQCAVRHVDGTYNALERNHELDWLKAPVAQNECRILANARCLSEGVDVPSLDAVLFLNPRNSVVDVVQSVGRVMRRAPDKSYGYIILPVGIPSGTSPSEALADNKRFRVVWQVLQALRAHDDRFDAVVNKLDLSKKTADHSLLTGHVSGDEEDYVGSSDLQEGSGSATPDEIIERMRTEDLKVWRDAILAKIVDKVGNRGYWEDWATDVADIAQAQETRIRTILDTAGAATVDDFDRFHSALRANLNDSVTRDDAIAMLSQHLITKPVFEALFEGYDFASSNPVSLVMQSMVERLDDTALAAETDKLSEFYESVRMRAEGIENASDKQRIIAELYEKFFRLGFRKTSEALGIVYTPVDVVDFIIRAANDVLKRTFGSTLADEGVHVLDPFTGTGTFIVRLLQSTLLDEHDIERKYAQELHANEIVLLAYYIAAVNIEATYHGVVGGSYKPFGGVVLTDTFQIAEDGDTMDSVIFPQNNDRILRQQTSPIRVVMGNPPYSAGQKSANDNNANMSYPTLDSAIESSYAAMSSVKSKRTLYDSYIRAIRWASDRIGDAGVVAYVTNGGWINSKTTDGLRLSLASEFDELYIYNLRGNTRKQGEDKRREGGQIFGVGSQATIAILIAVKSGQKNHTCRIYYRDIGDYHTRDEKLALLSDTGIDDIEWSEIEPNSSGDWLTKRSEGYSNHPALGTKDKKEAANAKTFVNYSLGLGTNRDSWVYNFSRARLEENVSATIDVYNAELARYEIEVRRGHDPDLRDFLLVDPTKISWSSSLVPKIARGRSLSFEREHVRTAMYRPFCKQLVYFDNDLNHRVGQLPRFFPTPESRNIGIFVTAPGEAGEFSVLATDVLPDLHLISSGQYFPRWSYVEANSDTLDLGETRIDGYQRVDNITDQQLAEFRGKYGDAVTKDDIFSYVYGVLHSHQYRSVYSDDLRLSLPRIPKATSRSDFHAFVSAGSRLIEMHVGYESVEPYPLDEVWQRPQGSRGDPYEAAKPHFIRVDGEVDRSRIAYNAQLTLANIPADAHRYFLSSWPALEMLLYGYQEKVDKKSKLRNDPNDWRHASGDRRYIIDLIKRVVRVSVDTVDITKALPELPI